MADNAKAPDEQDAPEEAKGDNQELAAAKAELEQQKKQYNELRGLTTRAAQENAKLRSQISATSTPDFSQDDDSSAINAKMQRMEQQNAALMAEVGETKFKQNHPDWQEYWPAIQDMLTDPVKVSEIASYGQGGQADVYKSLVNARMVAENVKARKILAEQAKHKPTEAAEVERQKLQATISGTAASAPQETVNVQGMSADEMLKKNLIEIDPRDPPKLRGRTA